MKTCYFGKLRKISQKIDDNNFVCISRSCPKGIKMRMYPKLAPPWELLNKYKNGLPWDEYVAIYTRDVLDKLDPHKVYQELGEHSVLFCYEKLGDDCHRHIVSDWLRKHGYDVSEWEE